VPDERVDDLAFEIGSFRAETREGFHDLRIEMRDGFREVRGEAALNRRWLGGVWATTLLGFVGLIVEVSLR